jgi:hypothetical protein
MRTIFTVAKSVAALSLILGAVLLMTCGGGGGGDGGGGTPPPSATVNATTAPQITSSLGTVITGVDSILLPLSINTGSSISSPKSLLRHARPLLGRKGTKLEGSDSSTEPCTNGGTVTLNATWDGPDDPQSCNEVRNPRLEFIFAACQEGTETLNGTMVMSIPGDLCDDTPSSYSISFNNARFQDTGADSDIIFNLTMNFSNVQYDANDYVTSMDESVSGSIVGTVEDTDANISYEDFSASCSGIEYDVDDNVVKATAVVNGRFYGTVEGDQFDEQYDDLTYSFEPTTINLVSGVLVLINGRYRGACMDGWVTFETLTPIFIPESSLCPTSGQVKISGNGQAIVTFNADGSVNIDVGGSVLPFATCDELPTCRVP